MRRLAGALRVPGDKSISHRYVMLGAMARGLTTVNNLAPGADVASTVDCFRRLGVPIAIDHDGLRPRAVHITGTGWPGLHEPAEILDAGNSGTTMRLMAGMLAGRPLRTCLTGDASLRGRPMARVVTPLQAMGARIRTDEGHAPLAIEGTPLTGISWQPEVPSAQVKSALMLAALSASGRTVITEPAPTRDHSERAFPVFGLRVDVDGSRVTVAGGQEALSPATPLTVPGDPSSAAVWAAAAAALPGSVVELHDVLLNARRLGFVQALRQMGADVEIVTSSERAGEPVGSITIRHVGHGAGVITAAEVPDVIDELPVLAARAALGGALEVSGAQELRVKESDRITALVRGLRALGVSAEERDDGFAIDGSRRPPGGTADAAGDHRLVMAFALVALGAAGPSTIHGADAVSVSYPAFARDLASLTS
ncbi:MAG TPA: 3-phosphoshikimate 1-carboxyvinyltransferase [Vicinamibacterales bacterium]|nr:3-phosphoshikimate 1-carboxyvinyltransferase [Vicinamibacterales bacterium]